MQQLVYGEALPILNPIGVPEAPGVGGRNAGVLGVLAQHFVDVNGTEEGNGQRKVWHAHSERKLLKLK